MWLRLSIFIVSRVRSNSLWENCWFSHFKLFLFYLLLFNQFLFTTEQEAMTDDCLWSVKVRLSHVTVLFPWLSLFFSSCALWSLGSLSTQIIHIFAKFVTIGCWEIDCNFFWYGIVFPLRINLLLVHLRGDTVWGRREINGWSWRDSSWIFRIWLIFWRLKDVRLGWVLRYWHLLDLSCKLRIIEKAWILGLLR